MTAIVTITRLTLTEAVRRRILLVLLVLTLVSVALTGAGTRWLVGIAQDHGADPAELQVGVSQVLILVAFMFSFVLAMTAAFLGAPAIAADVESGVALGLLARPIRRADLVVGRWLGLAIVVVGYTALSGLLEIAVVRALTGYGPPAPFVAVAYLCGEALVLLTLAVVLSTVLSPIAAGAICVVAFGLGWMAGAFAGIGGFFDAGPLVAVAEASRWVLPTDGLWRGAIHALEPLLVILLAAGGIGPAAEANPFYAANGPPAEFVGWSVAWIAAAVAVAVRLFGRREL